MCRILNSTTPRCGFAGVWRHQLALTAWVLLLAIGRPSVGAEVWHFLDAWHFHRFDGLELSQGQPEWLREKTYIDPIRERFNDHLNSWTTVWRDAPSGRWRMVYSARWRPATLMVAESDDGLDWRPLSCPDVIPEGGKLAPNHVFTLHDGSVGGVYLDRQAQDGLPFKAFAHRMGQAVIADARRNPRHPQHEEAMAEKPFEQLADELTLVSSDGLRWEARSDYDWGKPHWHPEPPLFGFWNKQEKRHFTTVRPGWGDRRICLQETADFHRWSNPAPLLQPDPHDGLVEFYGMPVFPYGEAYVGLLWIFHCETSEPPTGYNRFVGSLDTHLTYSYDGRHFQRGMRRPLIALHAPGEIGGSAIETSCLVETDKELRFYSDASAAQHGRRATYRSDEKLPSGIVIHTLRKDGLMFVRPKGGWGSFTSKPLALFEPRLSVNVLAPQGEARFQICDIKGIPLPGFSYDDCETASRVDELDLALRWKDRTLDAVVGKPIRLEGRLHNASLYAVRGKFHFLDAEDARRLEVGKTIDPKWFDY